MAENTSTYNAVINTEVKGTGDLDNLNKSVEETAEGFTRLQLRIRETQKALQQAAEEGDKAQFNKLKGQLEELEDQLEAVQLASGKFDDTLASLPGPAGAAGNAIKSVDGAFKLLAANPVVAVIAALGGLFLLLKESLTKTNEGQEVLNRLSEAFGRIIGPVMAIVQQVAIPVFEAFAFILEKVGEGFNKFAKLLGISQETIEEASRNSSEVLKEQYEEQQKLEDEAAKKAEEKRKAAAEKRKQEAEKRAQEEKERQALAQKILLESELSLLSERDRDLKERELRFQEELKALKAAGVTDLKNFEEEYRRDQLEINKKYDDEILKQEEETRKKQEEADKKAKDEAKKRQEEYDKFIVESEQFKADAIAFIQDQQISSIQGVGNILSTVAGKNKKLAIAGLVIEQGAAIAKVVVDTARSISAATAAAAPFLANPITAIPASANLARVIATSKIAAGISIAGIVAGAAKGIAQINQAQVPGGGGSAPAGGAPSIPTPAIGGASAPQIEGVQQQNTGTQIASTIAGAQQRPIRAYVVSQDVSSQQALDRRTNTAATFG